MAKTKDITTNSANIAKAVEQFGQEKVNTALANQSAKGSTITNTDTNTVAPASVIKTDYMKNRKQISASEPIVDPVAEAPSKELTDGAPEGFKYGTKMDSSTGAPELIPIPKEVVPEPLKTDPVVAEDGTVETTTPEKPTETPVETKKETAQLTSNEFVAKNEDEAFQVLQKGGTLANTAENAKFKARYNAYQRINAMDATSLADMSINGMIDQKQMDRLAQLNPQKWAEVNKLTDNGSKISSINQSGERLFNSATGKKVEAEKTKSEQLQEDLYNEVYAEKPSLRERKAELLQGNTKIKELSVELAEKDADIEETQDEIDRVYEDLRSQHPTLPKSMIMGMAAAATRDLNRTLTTKMRARNMTYAEYMAEKEDQKAEFEFEKLAMQEEQNTRNEKMNYLTNMFQTAKKDEDWEKQKEFEMEKLKQARIDGNFSAEQAHLRNLETLDMGQAFQSEQNQLQRDQAMEIVKMQMKGAGINFSEEKEDENGRYVTVTDTKNGTVKNVYLDSVVIPEETITANDGSTIGYGTDNSGNLTVDFGPTGVVPGERYQCAEVVNDKAGLSMGDDYDSKLKFTEKGKTPQVGDVFVSPRGEIHNGKNTGHTGFVKTVFPDGSIELWESNLVKDKNGKGITSTRIIKPTDSYYKELSFGSTNFSRNGGSVKGSVDKKILDLALSNLAQRSEGKWDVDMTKTDFARVVKDFGKGAPEVRDYLNNIIGTSKGQTETWSQMRNAINGMENVKNMLEEHKSKYGSAGFGTIGNLNQKVSELEASLGGRDIKNDSIASARIRSQIAILLELQAYRKSVTGAAASELESKEYQELFPKWGDSANVSIEKIQTLLAGLQRKEMDTQRDFLGGDSVYSEIIGGGNQKFSSLNDDKYATASTKTESSTPDFLKSYWNTLTMQ